MIKTTVLLSCLMLSACSSVPNDIQSINTRVNNQIEYVSDLELHGVPHLFVPDTNATQGDCEEYAYVKYVLLSRAGYTPAYKTYRLASGEGHMVVVAEGWTLDNRYKQIYKGVRY